MSFQKLLSVRLSDHFALVVGCININWSIGKPFRRRVLYLVATLFSWTTFSTTSPRAGCNLGLLENLFDESSSCLDPWLVGTFSMNESSSWLEPWLVGKPFRRGCNQLKDSTWKRFSKQLRWQLIGKPFRRWVLYLVATLFSSRTFCTMSPRAGCNLGLLENLFDESSSCLEPWLVGNFSTNESSSGWNLDWLENLFDDNATSSRTPRRTGFPSRLQPARRLIVEKVFQPAKVATSLRTHRQKGFPTSQGFNQLKHSSKTFPNQLKFQPARGLVVKKGFQPTKWLVKNLFEQAKQTNYRTRRNNKPTSQGCNLLEDSSFNRFSKQSRLEPARGLVLLFQPAKFATSLSIWHRKGFPTRQGCNQVEDSLSKRFSD